MTDKFYMKISLISKVDLFRVQTLLVASQSKNGVHKLTSHSKYLIILQSDQSLSQQTQQCFFLEDSSASMNICIKESWWGIQTGKEQTLPENNINLLNRLVLQRRVSWLSVAISTALNASSDKHKLYFRCKGIIKFVMAVLKLNSLDSTFCWWFKICHPWQIFPSGGL